MGAVQEKNQFLDTGELIAVLLLWRRGLHAFRLQQAIIQLTELISIRYGVVD